jgi:hypothetical protein
MCGKRTVSGCNDNVHLSRPGAGRPHLSIASANQAAGTGSAVTDLIFSIAKRDVTFLSGTVAINFL